MALPSLSSVRSSSSTFWPYYGQLMDSCFRIAGDISAWWSSYASRYGRVQVQSSSAKQSTLVPRVWRSAPHARCRKAMSSVWFSQSQTPVRWWSPKELWFGTTSMVSAGCISISPVREIKSALRNGWMVSFICGRTLPIPICSSLNDSSRTLSAYVAVVPGHAHLSHDIAKLRQVDEPHACAQSFTL